MKISLNWLKDYVAVNVSSETFAHKLTMAGQEVEKIQSVNGDIVFELEVTPNRPDCLNMIGVAREVSAIFNKPRKIPKIAKLKSSKGKCDIEIIDKKGCLYYDGSLVEGIFVHSAPEWIKK